MNDGNQLFYQKLVQFFQLFEIDSNELPLKKSKVFVNSLVLVIYQLLFVVKKKNFDCLKNSQLKRLKKCSNLDVPLSQPFQLKDFFDHSESFVVTTSCFNVLYVKNELKFVDR
jgi:hypothetical protein